MAAYGWRMTMLGFGVLVAALVRAAGAASS